MGSQPWNRGARNHPGTFFAVIGLALLVFVVVVVVQVSSGGGKANACTTIRPALTTYAETIDAVAGRTMTDDDAVVALKTVQTTAAKASAQATGAMATDMGALADAVGRLRVDLTTAVTSTQAKQDVDAAGNIEEKVSAEC